MVGRRSVQTWLSGLSTVRSRLGLQMNYDLWQAEHRDSQMLIALSQREAANLVEVQEGEASSDSVLPWQNTRKISD